MTRRVVIALLLALALLAPASAHAVDIVIVVTSMGPWDTGSDILYSGSARVSGMTVSDNSISWYVIVAPNALAATVNAAIRDAAIAAADDRGYTVGMLDKKTLIGAATGL